MESARLPRFQRVAGIAAIQLTERDLDIIRHVHRHRFLRSSHIVALTGGPARQILRRLQLLFHHGFLERPRAQIDYFHRHGSRPIVYGLANKGATLLRREQPLSPIDWQARNRAVGRIFLDHALLVADVMVNIELACRASRARLLSTEELPEALCRMEPIQWTVHVADRRKLGLIPDRFFGLEFPRDRQGPQRVYYFLEADRATMPVMRKDLTQTSFYRKLLAYEATWTQNIHRKQLGLHRFRVLTVTTSAERVNHIIEACSQLQRGHGLFLFADVDSLRQYADPLSFPWRTARSEETATLLT